MDQVVLEKPKPKCSAGRSKVNISSSPVRSTTGLSARPPPVLGNSESNYFFFPPTKSEYFFQQHWESEYFFLEKNP
jgi:hypothetical protein